MTSMMLRLHLWWMFLKLDLQGRDLWLSRKRTIYIGRLGVTFKRAWSFKWRFLIKRGAKAGWQFIRFGPLELSFPRPSLRSSGRTSEGKP